MIDCQCVFLKNPCFLLCSPLPHETIKSEVLPDAFTWCDKDGANYVSQTLCRAFQIYMCVNVCCCWILYPALTPYILSCCFCLQLQCTMSRNQHIPQYCGSCWAHGSVSALGDRVKIARGAKGIDINLAVQHILNCANVGSCHGGSVDGPYQWLHTISRNTGTGIAYETENPYLACSSESQEGICKNGDFTCTPENVAKTCSTFPPEGKCVGLSRYVI